MDLFGRKKRQQRAEAIARLSEALADAVRDGRAQRIRASDIVAEPVSFPRPTDTREAE